MQAILIKLLLWLAPGLGNPLASAIITAAIGIGQEEVAIMTPVVKDLIAQANANPNYKSGPAKFAWVFEQSVAAFPKANGQALGTLINVMVQEASVIASVL